MKKIIFIVYNIIFILLCGCSHSKVLLDKNDNQQSYVVAGKKYQVMKKAHGYAKRGIASWYGKEFHKRKTSSGERYNMYAMTAAHKTLPLFTSVLVTNLANGRKVIVKVNDRGPFKDDRLIDLSYAAAKKLKMVNKGTVPVNIKVLA